MSVRLAGRPGSVSGSIDPLTDEQIEEQYADLLYEFTVCMLIDLGYLADMVEAANTHQRMCEALAKGRAIQARKRAREQQLSGLADT